MARGYSRAEERNRAVRESLEPLRPGERPRVVTLGTAFSALIAILFWGSAAVAAFTGATVDGREPSIVPIVAFAAMLTIMAWGMWRARYWAVLGFQFLLVIFLIAAVGGLLSATTIIEAAGTTVLLAVAGTFFYFMVKAMARIQMPQRMPRE